MSGPCASTLTDCHHEYVCAVANHRGDQSGLVHRTAVWFDNPEDPTTRIAVEVRWGNPVPKEKS